MDTCTKVYTDDDIFHEDDDSDNENPNEFKWDIKKLQDIKSSIGTDIFESNYVLKKSYFITHRTDDIYDNYTFEPEPIGVGSFGTVFRAVEKATGQIRAIKMMETDIVNEVSTLKTLDHPNIIKLYEVYKFDNKVYLVQEFWNGGELFDYIAEQESLSEAEAAKFFQQMVSAIIYCHKNRICHRDLKPDNFMLTKDGDHISVKLIDFGISRSYFKVQSKGDIQLLRMQSIAGTTPYMAPEVFKRNYSNSCDTWSLGVILYIMLSGYPPFEGDTEQEIAENILKLKFDYDDEIWDEISSGAKKLISKILVEETDRITPKEVLNDDWLKKAKHYDKKIGGKIIERLFKFQTANRLKKTILSFLASKASDEECKLEISFFNEIDVNKDGYITIKELKKGIKSYYKGNAEDIDEIMKQIDTDGNGAINFNEFIAATLSNSIAKDYEQIMKAFKFFDKNNDGYINDKELKETLAGSEFKHMDTNIFKGVLEECSANKDGRIGFKEFARLMSIKIEDSMNESMILSKSKI